MKYLLLLVVTLSFLPAVNSQTSLHGKTVPKIEGGTQVLSAYTGKKILVVILPVTQSAVADSTLFSLDTLATNHSSSLQVIAVPAYEDGFTAAQKEQLKQWYRSKLSASVVITDGLYTRKSSGVQQHVLFKWLTMATENQVFDMDAEGPGHKFFANSSGQLYGVLRPQSKIWGASVQRTISMQ